MPEGGKEMTIKIWKQSSTDKFSIVDIPSYKAVSIFQLNGGKIIASVSRHGKIEYWSVQILDKMIDKTLVIIRDMKAKGFKFDDIHEDVADNDDDINIK
jgi:uncharacterized membrane protein